jgi:glycosyltransferase involved in cell wall biosynthesis
MTVNLSVIMPALNEAKNIEGAVRGVLTLLQEVQITDFEILVLTCLDRNGENDGTVDIVRRLAAEEPRVKSIHVDGYQRLGEKFRNGVLAASKEYIVMIPGDNENDPRSLVDIFHRIGEADMVLSYTMNPEVRPKHRWIISWIYTQTLNVLFGHRLKYYNGINVYRSADLRSALPTTDSFAYSAEIVLNLLHRKKTYVQVPIKVQERSGPSKALRWDNFKRVVATIVGLWFKLTWGKKE